MPYQNSSNLEKLDKIIEKVSNDLLASRNQKQSYWLRVLIGAGASWGLQTIRSPKTLLKKRRLYLIQRFRGEKGKKEYNRLRQMKWGKQLMVWDDYEFARFVSTNLCPPITYYFLHLLCERNLVDSIVTTNYDMYWESVCTRIPTKKYQVVVYPRIQKNKIKSDTVPKGEKTVRFWKIHGSFNILYHPECEDAIVHPPTVIGAISPYFLHKLCKNRYPDTFHDYPFSKGDSCGLCRLIGRTGPAIHFTDAFSPQRNPFRLLMKEALTDFLSPGRGMILSVGFRCGITEELRPIILRLATTTVPIVMFLHEEQQKLDRPLLERIERNPLSVVLHGVLEENLERFLRALFFRIFALGDTEWRKLVEGYRNWQGQQYFMYKIF